MSQINQFFPETLNLPTMPEVATKLLRSFNDDNISLESLADLIGKDQALAAKVLRLANSARYSPSHNISSLRDASAALGMITLRNLAMAACLAGAFPKIEGLDRKKFWRHGIASANYAVLLARAALLDSDTAYIAGLMMRSGQLLMLQVSPDQVVDVEKHVTEPGSRFGWEMQRFGCTHSDVTAELARRWQFPKPLLYGFSSAADPLEAHPFSLLGAVLRMAEVMADAMDLGITAREALQQAVPELLEHEHLDLEWLESKLPSAADLAAEVEIFVS